MEPKDYSQRREQALEQYEKTEKNRRREEFIEQFQQLGFAQKTSAWLNVVGIPHSLIAQLIGQKHRPNVTQLISRLRRKTGGIFDRIGTSGLMNELGLTKQEVWAVTEARCLLVQMKRREERLAELKKHEAELMQSLKAVLIQLVLAMPIDQLRILYQDFKRNGLVKT